MKTRCASPLMLRVLPWALDYKFLQGLLEALTRSPQPRVEVCSSPEPADSPGSLREPSAVCLGRQIPSGLFTPAIISSPFANKGAVVCLGGGIGGPEKGNSIRFQKT
jgi:hypothetical protein